MFRNGHCSLLPGPISLPLIAAALLLGACGNPPPSFTVGGVVTGLVGSGLVLQSNVGETLLIPSNGAFTFPTPIMDGSGYVVTVLTLPMAPSQTCSVVNSTGTMDGDNVTNVVVTCSTNAYPIGGMVRFLAGSGLVLLNNDGDDLGIVGNGTFTFPTAVASGSAYTVTVLRQPSSPWQTCSVTNAAGTIIDGPVANVAVTCAHDTYAVGGTVRGLAGSGLVLLNNSGDALDITSNDAFTFPTAVASGSPYAVTILTQPSAPWQTCTVDNSTGTIANAAITNVAVACTTNTYSVGGSVKRGSSSAPFVLQNNGGDNIVIDKDRKFTFPTRLESGSSYSVTISSQPQDGTCIVDSSTGTVSNANVTSVIVTCT